MEHVKWFFTFLLHKRFLKKVLAYTILVLFFVIFQHLLLIFFIAFIFAYLIYSLGNIIKDKIDDSLSLFFEKKKTRKLLETAFSLNIIFFIIYIAFWITLLFFLSQVLPQLIVELYDLSKTLPFLQQDIQNITSRLEEIRNFNTQIGGSITQIFSQQDLQVILDVYTRVKAVGGIFLQVLLWIILSIVFLFDREKVLHYLKKIKKSHFRFLYEEYELIFERGVKSFGIIIKAQSIIALVNSILTMLGLWIVGLVYGNGFPFILSLWLLVFILGFVPVLGTFLSSVPLIIIAYLYVGWINAALTIVALVVIIHAIEAYYLNPKIFSSFLELPVSLTFLILIVSEHFMGVLGLLIGVSVFYFVIWVLSDTNDLISDSSKRE
jgi:predicted PurR-regulated permease PerM